GLGLTPAYAERVLARIERSVVRLQDSDSTYPQWRRLVAQFGVSGKTTHDPRLVAAMNIHSVKRILTFNIEDFTHRDSGAAARRRARSASRITDHELATSARGRALRNRPCADAWGYVLQMASGLLCSHTVRSRPGSGWLHAASPEMNNLFGDLAVPNPRAQDVNVDPTILKLAGGGYLAVTIYIPGPTGCFHVCHGGAAVRPSP